MEKKTHYFYGHFPQQTVSHYQRVLITMKIPLSHIKPPFSYGFPMGFPMVFYSGNLLCLASSPMEHPPLTPGRQALQLIGWGVQAPLGLADVIDMLALRFGHDLHHQQPMKNGYINYKSMENG